MEKRFSIILAGVFFVTMLLIIGTSTSASAKPIKLTYANFSPAPTFPCVQMERWKKQVEERTGGKVAISTYPGGTLLDSKSIIDGVIGGQADIGNFVTAYHPGRFMVTDAASLPLGFTSAEQASQVLWDFHKKYRPAEFSKVKVLTVYSNPPANIMSKKPIRTLKDMEGEDLRGSGGAGQVLKAWGANPVGMPMIETIEALQKGVVKGLLSDLSVLKTFKFAEHCKYVTMVNSVIYPFVVVMNLNSWNALPKDVQKVMEDIATETSRWVGNYQDKLDAEAMEWSKKEQNVEVIELSKEEKAKWDKAVSGLTAKWIKDAEAKGLPGQKIVTDLEALKEKYVKN